MKRLLIADVHAGFHAFEAVLADVPEVDEIVFLGDVIGYGPHPAACVDRLRSLGARCLIGNHDSEILSLPKQGEGANSASPHAFWLRWTRDRLEAGHLAFLAALPTEIRFPLAGESILAIHRTPGGYLRERMTDGELLGILDEVGEQTVFCGHAHRAIDRTVEGRRLVCLPAIGQSRDGDPRAGYAIETDGVVEFHRVPYDVEATIADIRCIGLPEKFEKRWCNFLRTGHDAEWSRD